MKQVIITAVFIITAALVFGLLFYKCDTSINTAAEPDYAIVANLNGLGCIRLGETHDQVAAALDSCYIAYRKLRSSYDMIDHARVKRDNMLKYVGPQYGDTPDKYNKDYRRYHATLIISEELAANQVELYFWRDTLQKIVLNNGITNTRDFAEAMIWKYGSGKGYHNKKAGIESQLHKWGSDRCVATYQGKTEYILNSEGLANGVRSWYHFIEIKLNDTDMQRRIDAYLHEADSLWAADTYGGI